MEGWKLSETANRVFSYHWRQEEVQWFVASTCPWSGTLTERRLSECLRQPRKLQGLPGEIRGFRPTLIAALGSGETDAAEPVQLGVKMGTKDSAAPPLTSAAAHLPVCAPDPHPSSPLPAPHPALGLCTPSLSTAQQGGGGWLGGVSPLGVSGLERTQGPREQGV